MPVPNADKILSESRHCTKFKHRYVYLRHLPKVFTSANVGMEYESIFASYFNML